MNGVGARRAGGFDQPVDPEIALSRRARADRTRLVGEAYVTRAAVDLRVDRHGRQAHLPAGANHPDGNLAPVRDQDFAQEFRSIPLPAWWEQALLSAGSMVAGATAAIKRFYYLDGCRIGACRASRASTRPAVRSSHHVSAAHATATATNGAAEASDACHDGSHR